jgi:hypothetical protein
MIKKNSYGFKCTTKCKEMEELPVLPAEVLLM